MFQICIQIPLGDSGKKDDSAKSILVWLRILMNLLDWMRSDRNEFLSRENPEPVQVSVFLHNGAKILRFTAGKNPKLSIQVKIPELGTRLALLIHVNLTWET